MGHGCADWCAGRCPLGFFILVGSANLGALYSLCFSGVMVLRVCIRGIYYIIGFVSLFNLGFGFDLAWFTLSYVTNWPGRTAGFMFMIIFIVGLSTCGCWYVNGTSFVSTDEL